MYYTQEQIDRANQVDLVLFLQSQGEPLEHAGQEYRWKRHDSLTVRGNKWYRHSVSRGGGPVDFVMEFFGRSFTEAVELLTGEKGAAPPQDSPQFRLPPRSPDNLTARNYLTAARRIDEDVTGFFFASGDIYEDAAHHNAVFVGRDEDGIPRYAHSKGTAGNFRLDVKGSDKAFNFGQNYLKSLFAVGFQGMLILVCVAIYAVLIQGIATGGDPIGAIWGCVGYTVLLCFCLFKTGTIARSIFSAH